MFCIQGHKYYCTGMQPEVQKYKTQLFVCCILFYKSYIYVLIVALSYSHTMLRPKFHDNILYFPKSERSRFFDRYNRYALQFARTFFMCPYIHNNENTSLGTFTKILNDGISIGGKNSKYEHEIKKVLDMMLRKDQLHSWSLASNYSFKD